MTDMPECLKVSVNKKPLTEWAQKMCTNIWHGKLPTSTSWKNLACFPFLFYKLLDTPVVPFWDSPVILNSSFLVLCLSPLFPRFFFIYFLYILSLISDHQSLQDHLWIIKKIHFLSGYKYHKVLCNNIHIIKYCQSKSFRMWMDVVSLFFTNLVLKGTRLCHEC